MAAVRHLEFLKIFIIGHLAVIEFQMCCCVPNSSKSDDFSLRCGDLTICNMAAVRHVDFLKFRVKRFLQNLAWERESKVRTPTSNITIVAFKKIAEIGNVWYTFATKGYIPGSDFYKI